MSQRNTQGRDGDARSDHPQARGSAQAERQAPAKHEAPTKQDARQQDEHSNREKDPKDWVTGDEPMTGAQASYLQTLSEEAGEDFDGSLTKAQASERIEALQRTTGRGQPDNG